jgi:hypothetical protein
MSDIIITPGSGKIDFYQDLGASSLAKIELTNTNDLALSTTSGNLIIGDASRDVYIGNGVSEVDIVFEQNGEIRALPSKTLTIGASGAFTNILATKIGINQNSLSNIPLDIYNSVSGSTLINVVGTNGNLFSVTDNLSGSLMSVNNNAGLPVFEVFSDDRIVAGRFNQNDFIMTSGGNIGIGTGVPSVKLHVVGNSVFNGDISATGSFVAGSGTASLPSFEFVGDSDTGLFSPSANTVCVSTNGAERLRLDSIGNLGIGTTAPQQLVHISGNIPSTGNILRIQNGHPGQRTFVDFRIGSTGNYEDHFFIRRNGTDVFGIDTTNRGVFLENFSLFATKQFNSYNNLNAFIELQQAASPATSANMRIGYISEANLIFLASYTERMRLTGAGNLGIGTASPSTRLEVAATGTVSCDIAHFSNSNSVEKAKFSLDSGGNGTFSLIDGSNNTDIFLTSDINSASYINAGNLGVGISTPTSRLHVIGSGIFSSGIMVGDSSTNGIVIGPSGNTFIQFNTSTTNRIDIGSNTYTNSNTYLGTQFVWLNGQSTYVNGTLTFPKSATATSTATQSNTNSIIMFNGLWTGSAEVSVGNAITSTASTTTNLSSRFAFLMHNGDGTNNRTERLSILNNGNIGIGTTAPDQLLHVVGDINVSNNFGFRVNNTATSGQYLRGNGTRFVSSTIQSSDIPESLSLSNISITGLSNTSSFNNTGSLHFNNPNSNFLSFNASGVGAPTLNFGGRSDGVKIILRPSTSTFSGDYAFGIETNAVWQTVPGSSQSFKWYAGATNIATLSGDGAFTVFGGSSSRINVDNLRLDGNSLSSTNSNGPVIIQPSNYGAVQRTEDGDPRGQYSIDWQAIRSTGTQVAAGNYGSIIGGQSNTITSTHSSILGGFKNIVSGSYGVAAGEENNVSGNNSFIAGGKQAKTDKHGEFAHAAGYFATAGDAQHSVLVARMQTSNATATILTLDGAAAGSSNRITIPAKTTWTFDIKLSAYNDTGNLGMGWNIRGAIRRNGANGTALLGSTTTSWTDGGVMNGLVATVTADDTNEALQINVTGLASTNIRWIAVIDYSQVSY